MGKPNEESSMTKKDEEVLPKTVSPIPKEVIIQESVKVNLDSFANAVNLRWTAKARLEHYALANKILPMSIEDWQKLMKKV